MSGIVAVHILNAKVTVAVDIVDSRLALAKELGATHVINGRGKSGDEIREEV